MPTFDELLTTFQQATQAPASPDAAAEDARIERDYALVEQLETAQIYLSRQEVFAQDIAQEAFVTSDGVDLRSPLALNNLATAANNVNWQDSDTILRTLWAMDPKLAEKLRGLVVPKDAATFADLFARLAQENPKPATVDEAKQRYLAAPQKAMLGAVPLNLYIEPKSQIALRLCYVVAMARDLTAANIDMRQFWYDCARQQEPGLSKEEFSSRYDVDLSGVSGARRGLSGPRGIGYSGNFFKGLAKSISKLFKRPADWFRSAFKEVGRYVKLHSLPFTWLNKLPYASVLGGIMFASVSVINDELGNAMVSGSISTFNEQRVVKTIGTVTYQCGVILGLIGGVVTLIYPPIGAILVAVGAILVIAGTTILRLQAMARQARIDREEFERRKRMLAALKKKMQQGSGLDTSSAGASPASGGGLAWLLLAGGAFLAFR